MRADKMQHLRALSCLVGAALVFAALFTGCGQEVETTQEKRPRPVAVALLTKRSPPDASLVSASVGSWKTEQIGFEVSGRVEVVVEPNTEIQGRIKKPDGTVIFEGTQIARLESQRYDLQVQKATAEVTRAEKNLQAARIELDSSLQAQIEAAEASERLAIANYKRTQELFSKKATSQGEVDRDKAESESAAAQVLQLKANQKSKEAEVAALEIAVEQAKSDRDNAVRDQRDCRLYASYNGQIADVSVVPGSVVQAGEPVVTLQMMNPIKLELEVSADDSRRLQGTEMLPVVLTMPDGEEAWEKGYLYQIDAVADPLTRTFTVTVLVLNKKLVATRSDGIVATTDQTWRLDMDFLPGADESMLFAVDDAIHEDGEGHYVWQVTNATIGNREPGLREFQVRKARVELGDLKIPFLGNWDFQQVMVKDDEFDAQENLIVGRLTVSGGDADEWEGETVLLDSGGQWMLRPGDLVSVDLSAGQSQEGYYVPMDALARAGGDTFLFVVEGSGEASTVRRMPVKLITDAGRATTSSLRHIEAGDESSLEGLTFVTSGAHYLIDGEKVKPVNSAGADQ